MNDLIRSDAETGELSREIAFRSALDDQINEERSLSLKDPDRMVSIIVLVLACLGLAVLAHVVV
jgi:hypothetical protein